MFAQQRDARLSILDDFRSHDLQVGRNLQAGKDRKCCRRLTAWYRGHPCAKGYLSTCRAYESIVRHNSSCLLWRQRSRNLTWPVGMRSLHRPSNTASIPAGCADERVRFPPPAEKPRNFASLAQYATSVAGSHAPRSPLATSNGSRNSPANPPHTSPATDSQALRAIHTKSTLFRG